MKNVEYSAAFELSKDIIEYLHETTRDSYAEIGRRIGVTKAFISHVTGGRKSFALDTLLSIADAYNISLPFLLLEATKKTDIPKELKPLYRAAREVLKAGLDLERVSKRK